MLLVKVRGKAKEILDGLSKRKGSAWVDIWEELVGFWQETKQPDVSPGELGVHQLRKTVSIDGREAKVQLVLDRRTGTDVFVELIAVYPVR